jgi:hypothetical protein
MNFIIQLLTKNSNRHFFYIFKKESQKLKEKWLNNKVELSSTAKGLLLYYLLMFLKNPQELRNGLMIRLSLMKAKHTLTDYSFLSILARTLYLRFGISARINRLIPILEKIKSPKAFLIDEFISLNIINLKKLRRFGPIIYVSQDIAYNRFGFSDNIITKKLMYKLERDAVRQVDLIVACSKMEKLKYQEMGAKKVVFYPNIYPTKSWNLSDKDKIPSLSLVLRSHWGSRSRQSLINILNALACINKKIKLNIFGIRPDRIPENIILNHYNFIKKKKDYLKILSRSWIGINVGFHLAGTNERKYDYAEAGTVVFSDKLGSRGDLIPYEFTYIEYHDFIGKIEQLLKYNREDLIKMGEKNRKYILSFAENQGFKIMSELNKTILDA